MKKTAAFLIPVIAVIPIAKLCAALSVSVIPPILEISVQPGGKKVFSLAVRNTGDLRVRMTPRVMDLNLTPTGAALPVERGTSQWSCADWVSVDTQEFELKPGQKKEISMVLKVPRGVTGGRYCVVIFDAHPAGIEKQEPHLAISARTGTIIMETIPRRPIRKGEITDVSVVKADEAIDIVAHFRNDGNIHVQTKPTCVIKNPDGRIVDRVKMDAGTGTVLPEGIRRIRGTWANSRKMKPGSYVAEVGVDYRGGSRAKGTAEFSVD
jgi:hypothetical protein